MAKATRADIQRNKAMVLQALKNNNLSDQQARSLYAEIGRENGFQTRYLWGTHTDPYKGKGILTNIGMISWNGDRANRLRAYLTQRGLMQNGKIIQGQESLDAQVAFMLHEMRTNPSYARTKKLFLDNPNVDFNTAREVLGRNYIRWRYNDPKYAHGHATVRTLYREAGGITPQAGEGRVMGDYLNTPEPSLSNPSSSLMGNIQNPSAGIFDNLTNNTSNPLVNPNNDMFFNNPFNMPNTVANLIDFDPFEKGVNIDTDALGNPIKQEE